MAGVGCRGGGQGAATLLPSRGLSHRPIDARLRSATSGQSYERSKTTKFGRKRSACFHLRSPAKRTVGFAVGQYGL